MSLSKRILLDSVFLFCILFVPWYVLVAAGLFMYWKWGLGEIIGLALAMDIVYRSHLMHGLSWHILGPVGTWLGWIPYLPFTYGAVIAVAVLNLIKKRIR
jgi:hypothetical protein